jgi:hypothetical protein
MERGAFQASGERDCTQNTGTAALLIQGAMLNFAPFFDPLRCQGYGRRLKEKNKSKKRDR